MELSDLRANFNVLTVGAGMRRTRAGSEPSPKSMVAWVGLNLATWNATLEIFLTLGKEKPIYSGQRAHSLCLCHRICNESKIYSVDL